MLFRSFLGLSALLSPHLIRLLRDEYGALLSGAGVSILHITWLAAYGRYHLLEPQTALLLATCVGAFSLLLNARIGNSVFAIVAIAGTYLSGPFVGYETRELFTISSFFLLWNMSFAALALLLSRRDILLIASYFAVLTAGFYSLTFHPLETKEAWGLLTLQGLQFLIFSQAMLGFSLFRRALTEEESWATALLLLLYYAHVYSLLSFLAPDFAPWIGIILSVIVLLLHQWAQKKLGQGLRSSGAIASFASLVLVHCLYFKITPDEGKPLFSLALILLAASGMLSRPAPHWRVPFYISCLAIGYGAILTFVGSFSSNLSLAYHFGYGFVILTLALGLSHSFAKDTKMNDLTTTFLLLGFGHLEMLSGLYRLSLRVEMSGSIFVSLSWGVYALAILGYAWVKKNGAVGKSAVLILAAVSLKAAFYDVLHTGNLVRVLSLLASGLLLYSCGWIFRQMQSWNPPGLPSG